MRSFLWSVISGARAEYGDLRSKYGPEKTPYFDTFHAVKMPRHINHRVLYQSIFRIGFNASYAFDGNNNTSWYPSGWGMHDNNDDWIGFEFPVAVRIHAVRMKLDEAHRTASPKKIFVEAADRMAGPFRRKWVIKNPTYEVDNVYKVLGTFFLCS